MSAACLGKQTCKVDARCEAFHEKLGNPGAFCWGTKKSLAVKVGCEMGETASATQAAGRPVLAPASESGRNASWFLADFGKELQGGVILGVKNGRAGQTVEITCGESLSGSTTVGSNWGWVQQWTLRDGAQTLEQHKYMECRFVTLAFSGEMSLAGFTLSAWTVHYPWYRSDSHFSSSNATLNAVFELSRYTLEAGSLDTYTDSNTRERRPYEADGIIVSTARLLVQRDFLWGRHSHAWVIEFPTCPVEWQQATPFLGYQDFMATGRPDLALAFAEKMFNRTMISYRDAANGLVKTVDDGSMHYGCSSGHPGMRIIDWMPDTPEFSTGEGDHTVQLGEFTASNFASVDNFFAQRGLEMLASILATAPGRAADAARIASMASELELALKAKMWNETSSSFCDGICEEVGGNSRLMTSMFSLCFGQVPAEHAASVWAAVSLWGLEKIGDYGAFFYLMAMSGGGLYSGQGYETPDDGTAVLTALTKCDRYSWCSGLRDDNLTMTRESWHEGTYSHQWGTSPVVGVTIGVMGIKQTAPAWRSFTVKPKLGTLTHAAIVVPTISGYINVTATPTTLAVNVPCNTAARLCVPRSQMDTVKRGAALNVPVSTVLVLDDVVVDSIFEGGHLCTRALVGCGAYGVRRVLRASK